MLVKLSKLSNRHQNMIRADGLYNTVVLALMLLTFGSAVTTGNQLERLLDIDVIANKGPFLNRKFGGLKELFEHGESQFPDGPYSLVVPATGCVEDETQGWGPGYILFSSFVNSSSSLLTIDAPNWPGFAENISFLLSFCTKHVGERDKETVGWPLGHYGVFKTLSDCPSGFLERSNHFQLPEFQTWESEGALPDIDLFPDNFSMMVKTCIKEKASDGTNSPKFDKAVYLLKDSEFGCPTFDGYEVTEERLLLECIPGEDCVNFSMCHVKPNITTKGPVYDLDEWHGLGDVASGARCLEALGMADGTITDEQLSASSYDDWDTRPQLARPGYGGWLADATVGHFHELEYFQIDLRTVMMIEGIEIQHGKFPSEGVVDLTSDNKTMYESSWLESSWFRIIKYAIANGNFRRYNDKMLNVYRRAEDGALLDLYVLNPFAARFVRMEFFFSNFYIFVSKMRFELIGCQHDVKIEFHDWKESVLQAACFDDLGMNDGTMLDLQITASSWIPEYEPILARPGLSGWCADLHDPNPYIEVNLIVKTYVQGLTIYDMRSVVKPIQTLCNEVIKYTTFFVSFSEEPPIFKPYKAQPFKVSTVKATGLLFLTRFLAKSVRIEVTNVGEDIPACLRFDITGCRFEERSMSTTCRKDVASSWIDNPIILPDTAPSHPNSLLSTSLEACEELCLNEMKDDCSTVQFLHGNSCIIYPVGDRHRSKVISPESNVGVWRTRVCLTERANVNRLEYLGLRSEFEPPEHYLTSSGYPFNYASAMEQVWTIERLFPWADTPNLLFTNISLYPPSTDECVDKITIEGYSNRNFPAITYQYNGAILFEKSDSELIKIKLISCPRANVGKHLYYGFRLVVCEWTDLPKLRQSIVWPFVDSILIQSLNLLGHPLHTLTQETWNALANPNSIIDIWYFNVPCNRGHQLTLVSNNTRYWYCGTNRPELKVGRGQLTIEYTYDEPVFGAGFAAHITDMPAVLLEGYVWPGQGPNGCFYDDLLCSETYSNASGIECVNGELLCDGERHCTNNKDESEYWCHHFLPTDLIWCPENVLAVCSEEAHRCHSVKEIIGKQDYRTRRNYTRDCSDLKGRYTLPIIHNEQQMRSLRILVQNMCFNENAQGCKDIMYLDIGLRRYYTDDGIEELWEDGTKVSFTAWRGERTPSLLCTSLVFDNPNLDEYHWEYRSCEQSRTSAFVICEQPYKQGKQGLIFAPTGTSDSHVLPFSSHKCVSGEVIHTAAVCDGVTDCSDGSDETNCETHIGEGCTFEEFACGNGTCIGLHNVCDYKQDCFPDGDDELCEFLDCEANQFMCENKQCIPSYSRCDATKDCIDGTDETRCDSCNDTVAFPCEDLTCIHKSFVCDGINTCKYGRDELNCGSGSKSTCFDLWQAGYRNGTYLLYDVLRVQCKFTAMDNFTINVTTEMDLDVYVHGEGFKVNMSSLWPHINITKGHKEYAESSSCEMKIEVGCTQNIQMMELFKEIGPEDKYSLCGEQTINVRINWSREIVIRETDSEGISSVHEESRDRPDILIMQPQRKLTQYSTVEFGKLKCFKEYIKTERVIGCEDGSVAPMSTRCIYDIGRAGEPTGCRSFVHLENCGEFKCPSADYVKCPGHYCIPERFVCDGVKHCRDGADELDCGCSEKDGQVTIVYSGEASEVKRSYIYKLGRLFLSSRSDVRVVSLDIGERNVGLKSRTIHHSNEALNLNKWQTRSVPLTRVTDFIVALESVEHNVIVIYDDDMLDDLEIDNSQISTQWQRQINIFSVYMMTDQRLSVMKSAGVNRTEIFVKTWDIIGSVGQSLIENCQGTIADRCISKFRCMSSMVCIPLRQVCDGITQCLFGDDERLCDFNCPENCSCGNYVIDCSAKQLNTTYLHTVSTSVRSLDLSFSRGIFDNNNVYFPHSLSVLVRLNVSSCFIADIADSAFEKTKNLISLDLSNNKLRYITKVMFKGLMKLRNLIMTDNNQLESLESHAFQDLINIKSSQIVNTRLFEIVPETFSGLRLSTLDISNNNIRKIYDMAFSGLLVDTLKLDGNDISEFSRDIFSNMRNVKTIISPAFKFCCYRPDYVEGKNCLPAEDEFSSCEDLMRNSGLQTLLWVVGVSALVGNCLSIVYRLTFDKVRLKLGFGIFVTNLAISDFLMGIYLLIIAVADLIFRNRYIEVEAEWRTSNYCKLAGVLATVSSEASVIFMCLITLDRIFVIRFPFGNIRFRTKSALVASVVGWVLAWGIALFPLLDSKSFDGQFYSKSGACLALPLTRDRAPGWLYSVLIFVGLNFITFILIAIGQAIIYLEIRAHTKRMMKMAPTKQSMSRRNDMIVARNLFLVLTTDFLCWFPIGVMAILALQGYPISGDVYAWTAVTVLPINSALNPILYTATAILRRKKFNPRPEEQAPRAVDRHSLKRLLLSRYIFKPTGEDLTSIATLLSDEQWTQRPTTTLLLARSIVKILCKMHECDIIHGELNADTVFVTSRNRSEVFMNVTPKACRADAEKRKDMHDFGQLLHTMMKKTM